MVLLQRKQMSVDIEEMLADYPLFHADQLERSMTSAMPWPSPTHMVSIPRGYAHVLVAARW
ncbi:hypothetical protein ACTWPB_12075 [Nocardia sp. IBHARD005]|uniref:hypothetical protein n=1 Tax=Nocardia sp. IBHARD005 TaxID=3457765 RepID=UPI004057D380